ncbi:MAG: hypothetical protein U0271_17085 [Polyangiaceae bacterium]
MRRWVAVACLVLAACGDNGPTNPYVTTGTGGAGGGFGGAGGASVDPELGGPCVDGASCDDALDCTEDSCDMTVMRCRFHPVDSGCQDGVYCNGSERCDQNLGCQPGPPVNCSDGEVCTIDTCVEATASCTHVPRDADGDLDPDVHCGGGDCDESDPGVNSLVEEVCGNGKNDDCDADIDEADCATPTNDVCVDALVIDASGSYTMTTFGAAANYPTSCTPEGTVRDVVAAIVAPDNGALDVVARAQATTQVSLALATQCGDAATEIACSGSFPRPSGGQVSRVRARSVASGAILPLYVTTVAGANVPLEVSFVPPTTQPTNETCGTADPLPLGVSLPIEIVDAAKDLTTACASLTGELVYELTVDVPSDLDVYAVSVDGDGQPSISLRTENCALPEDEIACVAASPAHLYRHCSPRARITSR